MAAPHPLQTRPLRGGEDELDAKLPTVFVADVLGAERLLSAETVHYPGWAVPTSGGGAIVQPGGTDVAVGAFDRLWVRGRDDGRERHVDLPAGALPARAGHAVAAVSVDGQAAIWANLTTGHEHHAAQRAPAVEARLGKWMIVAVLLGLLAAIGIAGDGVRSAPQAMFALVAAAAPGLLALLSLKSAVARARERDKAVDAALAAATADARTGGRRAAPACGPRPKKGSRHMA